MPYRIAFASADGANIDRHFGAADSFLIIEVEQDGSYRETERRPARPPCRHGSHDEPAMQEAADALSDCLYVAAEAIGPGAQRALERAGVLPLEVQDITIADAVKQIHKYELNKRRASVSY